MKAGLTRIAAVAMSGAMLYGQQTSPIVLNEPKAPALWRPYLAVTAPPARLANTPRLNQLIRGGKLYLTAQDAIALAIENNLDLEVSRYGPLAAEWRLERAEAGGPLRGVTSGSSQIGSVASGQGVAGSQASAGLSSGSSSSGGGGGGAAVSQIGPVTANLDPVLQHTTLFSHTTSPQANTVQSQTSAVVDTQRLYNTSVQQGLITGGYVQVRFNESYLRENAPTNILNPSVAPRLYLYVQHNFLSGFGVAVNSRGITVARRNVGASAETFRSQLLDLVANVLNQYWGLVSADETLKSRQRALDVAKRFHEDTQNEIRLGVLSQADIYRARLEVSTRQQDYNVAASNVRQQENQLKNVLSRNGLQDPLLDAASIVPIDRIEVPATDDLPPLRDLVARALAKRPDVAAGKVRMDNAEISALGTANGILPTLVGLAQTYNSGLAGESHPYYGEAPDPYFVGGFGTAAGQVFRRNFPNNRAAVLFQGSLGNRVNQGDFGIDQLQLRQGELSNRRDLNQIVVDISNQLVALKQARARYSAAVDTRTLQEQLLEKIQQSFRLGGSTFNDVIVAQRSLVNAQSAEVSALAAYARAKVGLDQVLGETLERNQVSVDDALKGRIPRESTIAEPKP
ncbi:MAG: TolC family protein [Acidobacteria bacterium]|nr:TolC family protein [Acidobacteriota bacterium]